MVIKEQISLKNITDNTTVRLLKIDAGAALKSRLSAMGLLPGTQFKVINNGHPGPFVISLKGSRIMLGRGMAAKIFVRPI
ncbi:MAG: ferrous iron transport protein A [Phycisphaerae bacterium]|nr:ferrous iron transport protein A [Phycisphaerae bacterium]